MIAAFLDLDRTLIHSARSVPRIGQDLVVVERIDGEPSAYAPRTLAAELGALAEVVALVPTTTRSIAQLRRVTLFERVPHRFEIAANGGVILEHGVPDIAWSHRIAEAIADAGVSVPRVRSAVAELVPSSTVRIVDDVFVYLVAPVEAEAESAVGPLSSLADGLGWHCSRQGRKVYLVPTLVEKAVAVAEVARRLGASTVLAAGDAELDRRMLFEADHAVVPAHADVARPPRVRVTAASGPAASTEIVGWLHSIADRHHDGSLSAEPDSKEARWTSAVG